jgi:hypothetical protein
MIQHISTVTPGADQAPIRGNYAPLTNVVLTRAALAGAYDRALGLPGIVVLHGPSGFGKSTAATFAHLEGNSYYISMQRTWDWRDLVDAICVEMRLVVKGRTAKATAAISDQLAKSGKMLFLDEAHILCASTKGRGLVWDLYERTQGVILLIGEETLPQRLEADEFIHGRVYEWVAAQPATIQDTHTLTLIYCPDVQISGDLIRHIAEVSEGSARRISINLDRVRRHAKNMGWKQVDTALWGNNELYTGKTPSPRAGYSGRQSERRG